MLLLLLVLHIEFTGMCVCVSNHCMVHCKCVSFYFACFLQKKCFCSRKCIKSMFVRRRSTNNQINFIKWWPPIHKLLSTFNRFRDLCECVFNLCRLFVISFILLLFFFLINCFNTLKIHWKLDCKLWSESNVLSLEKCGANILLSHAHYTKFFVSMIFLFWSCGFMKKIAYETLKLCTWFAWVDLSFA